MKITTNDAMVTNAEQDGNPLESPALRQQPVPPRDVTVMIKDATKTYNGTHVVLKGINMTVHSGRIFGLLGPSGCGKTTLLNIIVGRCEFDSGEIMVKATKREDIGYMPQDLDLHKNLTIMQTYKFYGYMLNMNMDDIVYRAKGLEKMLELPSNQLLIEELSGGQQRRVSLAVALLHNPNILILDEPTVGLDPILSNSVWNHLVSFSEQGKTIIITTHYIEEARRAHTVGMMRDGILVAEESPEILIARWNTFTLEEVFLALSDKQQASYSTQVNTTSKMSHSKNSKIKLHLSDGVFRKNRLISLLYKNFYLLIQQKSFSVFLVLLPLVTSVFFNIAIGHDPKGLKIAVVNKELQKQNLKTCKPDYYNECFLSRPQEIVLSCAYIKHIQSKSWKILYYDEIDTALTAVRKNDAWGLLYFADNYTISMANRFTFPYTSNQHVEQSTVQAWIDLSNRYIGSLLKTNVVNGLQTYLDEELSKCDISSKIGSIPILFKPPVYGSVNISFINYASAAMLCLLCYFLPALFTLSLIMTEKQEGMMERMLISGIKFREVILSTFIIQLMIHIVQTVISTYVIYVYFDNPYLGDHLPGATVLILLGIEGMILGFLLGAMCNSFMVAAFLGAGINIAFCLTCGLIWPLEGTHYLMKLIGPLFPLNAPVNAMVVITNKGWSFGCEPVYLGIASIVCWSIIKIIAIFIISRVNKDLWVSRK